MTEAESGWRKLRDAVWARTAQGHLSAPQTLVALRLVEHWPDIYPGEKTLARWTQLGESTVRRALGELQAMKVIRIIRNPGRGNIYEFLDTEGNPIRRTVPNIGPWPVPQSDPARSERPPRSERAVTPSGASGVTPLGASAEADPDLKQDPKQEREAGARELLPHEKAEKRKALEPPDGSRPAPLYRFRDGWKPKQSHRALGLELGLTEPEMLAELADCRDKVYERPIQSEDAQFRRELRWLAADKQTKKFREQRKANPHGLDENPGSRRRIGEDSARSVFGGRRAG